MSKSTAFSLLLRSPRAALAEPAAVALARYLLGAASAGERIAVVGDGTVGLITAHPLRLFSPAGLVVVGQRPQQAGLAGALGATGYCSSLWRETG